MLSCGVVGFGVGAGEAWCSLGRKAPLDVGTSVLLLTFQKVTNSEGTNTFYLLHFCLDQIASRGPKVQPMGEEGMVSSLRRPSQTLGSTVPSPPRGGEGGPLICCSPHTKYHTAKEPGQTRTHRATTCVVCFTSTQVQSANLFLKHLWCALLSPNLSECFGVSPKTMGYDLSRWVIVR